MLIQFSLYGGTPGLKLPAMIGSTIIGHCQFYSSHYIGRYSHEGYAIIINPRFGNIFNYLVSYASNIYIPYGESEISFN